MIESPVTLRTVTVGITDGVTTETVTATKKVFAEVKSVGYNEFYQATSAGFTVSLIFRIREFEYEGQTEVLYKNEVYKVIRTYYVGSTDYIELTCERKEGK